MSKIIGVTVGTPISAAKIDEEIKPVKTVNNKAPDDNGNVNIEAGGIDTDELQGAIEDALAEAKASGEFDGADGKDGTNGKDGANGKDGKDGVSATHSWNGTTLTITSASGSSSANLKGAKGDTGEKGVDGAKGDKGDKGDTGANGTSVGIRSISESELPGDFSTITFTDGKSIKIYNGANGAKGTNGTNGKDGTSVTVSNVSESTASGGTNTVTFSDGKKVNIKNGKDGSNGTNGTSVTVSKVTESTSSGGTNVVTFSDGNTLNVKNGVNGTNGKDGTNGTNGTNGKDGADGERGTGILPVTTAPSSYTTATGGFTPVYRIALSTVKTQSGVSSVFVGDQLRYSYYLYPVGYVDSSYVYLGTRVSIRGATGAAYTLTDTDKTNIANAVKASLPTLTMTGKDADGVEHTWTIYGS
jgi:hypothetical protein